jgi:hypothetical protein
MRSWKAIADPQGFHITLEDQIKLIFVGADRRMMDHIMKHAVHAAIEETK